METLTTPPAIRQAALEELENERKRLQILVGTDKITPDEARKLYYNKRRQLLPALK